MLNNLSGVTELSGGHLGFSTFLGPSPRWNYQANWGLWWKASELTTNTCFVSKVEKGCTCHAMKLLVMCKGAYELDHKESNAFKFWCWKRLLRVPWTARRSNQLILKEINPEYSLEGLMPSSPEAAVFWPPDVKSCLTGKDPDAGRDWRREENRTTEDEMVGWHHWLNGHEFEKAPGDGEGQGSWHAAVHGLAKSWRRLGHWTTTDRLQKVPKN